MLNAKVQYLKICCFAGISCAQSVKGHVGGLVIGGMEAVEGADLISNHITGPFCFLR